VFIGLMGNPAEKRRTQRFREARGKGKGSNK